jgi:hypothetical protein
LNPRRARIRNIHRLTHQVEYLRDRVSRTSTSVRERRRRERERGGEREREREKQREREREERETERERERERERLRERDIEDASPRVFNTGVSLMNVFLEFLIKLIREISPDKTDSRDQIVFQEKKSRGTVQPWFRGMAHACKKPSSVLTKDQAIEIFRLSLTHSSKEKRSTATSVARTFDVSEKTVRDIWSARTWHDETLPLDVNRTPRAAKKIGRPHGRFDSKPRKPRTVKSLSSTPQTQETDNAKLNSPLYCISGDSSSDQTEILDLSCEDFPTISSQPAQESLAAPPGPLEQM